MTPSAPVSPLSRALGLLGSFGFLAFVAASLLVAHPPRPGRAPRVEWRNSVLDRVAEQDWSGQAVLLGDLNTTRTSPMFGRLLEATGLRDSRRGFGRQPTFTTAQPIAGLEIAIDHVLVSDSVRVLDRRIVALEGSDHKSVVVRVAARANP